MSIYKINEKTPDLNQYCFVKLQDDWAFATYAGQNETDYKWNFFNSPSQWIGSQIVEWQPATLSVANPTINLATRKVTLDLMDIHNEEKESMWEVFRKTVYGEDNDNTSGTHDCIEVRG